MSDWKPGDLALCVDDSPRAYTIPGAELPKAGRIYRVMFVGTLQNGQTAIGVYARLRCGKWRGRGFASDRFRKVRPDKVRPDQHSGSIEDWNDILKVHRKKAPSEGERTKRIIEALFPQSTTERPVSLRSAGGDIR